MSKAKYTEAELVAALCSQDNDAFNYLYDNYSAALMGIVTQIIPDHEIAADVLQDVFVNIWKKISYYDETKGRLFTWMLNVARNAAIDRHRSKAYQNSLKNQPLTDTVNNSENQSITPVTTDIGLKKLISTLKQEHRELIELSYFQGYTHEEISKMLDMPLGTVKTRIRAALLQLRTLIQ